MMLARVVLCLIVLGTTTSLRMTTACHGDVRLVGGTDMYNGRVELCLNGIWKRVCANSWHSSNEGRVVCRQLGCSSANRYYWDGYGTQNSVLISSCISSASGLSHCSRTTDYDCTSTREVGVGCTKRTVSVTAAPARVTSVSIRNIKSTSFTVSYPAAQPTTSCSTTQTCATAQCVTGSSLYYDVQCTDLGGNTVYQRNGISGTSAISVTGLQSNTQYRCHVTARNNQGSASLRYSNTVRTALAPPNTPRNLQRRNVQSSSFELSWLPPLSDSSNRQSVSYYRITCSPGGYSRTTSSTTRTVTSLQPYTSYNCCVLAVGSATAEMGNSVCITTTTAEAAPSCSPRSFQSNPSNSPTTLSFRWTSPSTSCHNGIIRSYRLRVCNLNGPCESVTSSTTSKTVTGLQPYYYYDVSVAAYTVAQGPYSTTLRRLTTQQNTPNRAPQHLTSNALSPTRLSLSWNPVPLENRRGVIRWYDVIVTNTNTGESVTRTDTRTDRTSITVSSLHPHYNYTISVAAYTIGVGPYATHMVKMPEDVPSGRPTILSLTTSDLRTLQVSWLPPPLHQQNGVIRRHQVRVCRRLRRQCTSHHATGLTLIVTDLHPYYWYGISVAAVTVALGPYTTERTIQLPEDVPDRAPQHLVNNTISSTSVHLSWSPPPEEYQNGVIRRYNINITNTDTTELERKLSIDWTFITVSSLHPHYNYTISVAAYTVGVGPYASQMVTMLEDAPSSPPQSLASEHVNRTSVILSWEPPSPPDQNGVIRYYTITLYNTTSLLRYTTNETSLTLTQLTLNATYYWSVTAHTISPGPPSNDTTLYIPLPKRSKALEIGLYSTAGILFPVIVVILVLAVCFVYHYGRIPSKLAQLKRNSNGDKEKTDTEGNDNQAQNTYTNRLPWQRIHFKRSKKQSKKTAHTTSKGEDSHTTTESHYDVPVPTLPERRYLEDIDFVAGEFDMILKTQPELPERDYLEDIDFMVDEIMYPNKEEDNTPQEESQAMEMKPLTTNTRNNDKVYENLSGVKETSHQPMSVNEDETTGESHYQPLLITHQQTQQSSDYESLQIRSKPTGIGSTTDNNNSTGHYQPLMLKTQQTESQYAEVRGGLRLAVEKTNTAPQTRSGRKRDAKNIPILPKPSAKKTQVRFNDTLQN